MSNVDHKLYRETEAAKVLLAQLKDIIGEDEDCAADMVEGETNINAAIDAVVQRLSEDMAALKGINDYIETFTRRKDRIKQRIDNTRTALAVAMELAGRKKIEHPAVTLSLRAVAPSVVIKEEGDIPSAYWEPQPPKLNKRELLKGLKEHGEIPGATLSNGGMSVSLRWS